jgi:hypothetical protein
VSPSTEQELLSGLNELRANVRTIAVKLFGEEQGESSEGRIPRLERRVNGHDERITKLEGLAIKLTLIGSLAVVVIEYIVHNGIPHLK